MTHLLCSEMMTFSKRRLKSLTNLPQSPKALKQRLNVKIHTDLMTILEAIAKRRDVDLAQLIEQAVQDTFVVGPRSATLEIRVNEYLNQVALLDQKLDAMADFIASATRRNEA
jgi:predicted DNA-binding ribbon-helix-helix protein